MNNKPSHKKRIYEKPEMALIRIDNHIILMAVSEIGHPESAASFSSSKSKEGTVIFEKSLPSKSSTPFGGSKPEY